MDDHAISPVVTALEQIERMDEDVRKWHEQQNPDAISTPNSIFGNVRPLIEVLRWPDL